MVGELTGTLVSTPFLPMQCRNVISMLLWTSPLYAFDDNGRNGTVHDSRHCGMEDSTS